MNIRDLLFLHIHKFLYSLYTFPLWFISGYWTEFPVLYSRILLLIQSVCNSLHLLTPTSHFIPPPSPTPLAATNLFSMSVSLYLFHIRVHLCYILDSTYKQYHMLFVFFWCTSLCMIISWPIMLLQIALFVLTLFG